MQTRKRTRRSKETTSHFGNRLVALRALQPEDPAAAGDQALKLLEEYLESLAHSYGYRDEGSLGRYAMFLRGRDALSEELLARIEGYTQVRNCLAHSYGLQTSPALAAELLDFADLLLKQGATTAAQLMTHDVRAIAASERLLLARDLMLSEGYGRLPVLHHNNGVTGLLTERDVVVAQSLSERSGRPLSSLSVADALPGDAADRIALVSPGMTRDEVVERLRHPGVIACLVTPGGTVNERPIGIITHADLLYRT